MGSTMWRLAVFCAILAVVRGQLTNVSPCAGISGDLLPLSTYIPGCVQPPCDMPYMQTVPIDIVFQAPRTVTTMRTNPMTFIPIAPGIIVVQVYDLGEQAHTCNFLTNTNCPVSHNEIVHYRFPFFIQSWFLVGVEMNIELDIIDEAGSRVACLRIPMRAVSAKSQLEHQELTKNIEDPRSLKKQNSPFANVLKTIFQTP